MNIDQPPLKLGHGSNAAWYLLLSTYEYSLPYCPAEAHCNADALSGLPLLSAPAEVPTLPELVLLLEYRADSPITASHSCSWTQKDPVLTRVLDCVRQDGQKRG